MEGVEGGGGRYTLDKPQTDETDADNEPGLCQTELNKI